MLKVAYAFIFWYGNSKKKFFLVIPKSLAYRRIDENQTELLSICMVEVILRSKLAFRVQSQESGVPDGIKNI